MTIKNNQKRKPPHLEGQSNEVASDTPLFTRRSVLFALGAVAVVGSGWKFLLAPTPAIAEEVVVYKDPSCVCCGRWVKHLRRNGFKVSVNNVDDMGPVKQAAGIPDAMESCHTAYVGGYAIEGHVPASDIQKILLERPTIKGLAVPGMPSSAPGMDSPENEPYTVMAFDVGGTTRVFASY